LVSLIKFRYIFKKTNFKRTVIFKERSSIIIRSHNQSLKVSLEISTNCLLSINELQIKLKTRCYFEIKNFFKPSFTIININIFLEFCFYWIHHFEFFLDFRFEYIISSNYSIGHFHKNRIAAVYKIE